ncbi:MAG: hypothetical protein IPL65_04885 [Lewinellaceae bacterium]|nr:hypothetical protein [Lewinellaceae bacterium]
MATGFPALGVSAIAITTQTPNVMYAGTGEVYNYENAMPNVAIRTTRGTYGIGILKSTDGGQSWTKSLDWSYGDMRGVQDIKINPLRPETVYAATTEGLLRSYDAGETWSTIHNLGMAVDIEINPADTNIVFVTHGSYEDNSVSGIYRSVNGGDGFIKLINGLPGGVSGKILLGMAYDQPAVLYASIGNAFAQEGLYKTTTNGGSWAKVSTQDVCTYQGWYSHDVAVRPSNTGEIIWTGIDLWKSTNSGQNVQKKTKWFNWYFGQVPVGGPEGPADYVHADIHRVYYLPNDNNKVYCVTDGGIFVSYDAGESWHGRNGGYQTQQFYANLGNSTTNPNLCIGGMQDNSTAIYSGDPAWTRVLGGDGECAAVYALDDQVMYGSSQYLNMSRSTNGGANWQNVTPTGSGPEQAAFNGPFELAQSEPEVLYAGAESLFRSDDGGSLWYNASNGPLDPGNVILTLAPLPTDASQVWCSVAPLTGNQAKVFLVNAVTGGVTSISGLPNRLCMDIAPHPGQAGTAYAVFSGFNTAHVWRTTDFGQNWEAIDNGLPDIPTNSVLIDPLFPDHIYVGNDVGVWLSRNGGNTWELYSTGAPAGMLAMHLSISANRKLRVATYGLGVWQADMAEPSGVVSQGPNTLDMQVFPNPASDVVQMKFALQAPAKLGYRIFDLSGRMVLQGNFGRREAGNQTAILGLGDLPAGRFALVLDGAALPSGERVRAVQILLKE